MCGEGVEGVGGDECVGCVYGEGVEEGSECVGGVRWATSCGEGVSVWAVWSVWGGAGGRTLTCRLQAKEDKVPEEVVM